MERLGIPMPDKHFDEPYGRMDQPRTVRIMDARQLPATLSDSTYDRRLDFEEVPWRLEEEGIEFLAWYVAVHAQGPHNWGIYFHGPRMMQFAEWVRVQLGEPYLHPVLVQTTKAVLHHERFHFLVECAATHMEQHTEQPIYTPYKQQVYRPCFPHETCIEEGLANAYKLTRRYDTSDFAHAPTTAFRDVLRQACDMSPRAYRGYRRWLDDRQMGSTDPRARLRDACGRLAHMIRTQTIPQGPIAQWAPLPGIRFDLWSDLSARLTNSVPMYVVFPPGY
jgi:hypothetical protein